VILEGDHFESLLHVKDGPLSGAPAFRQTGPGKPAPKHDARCLGRDHDVLAKIPPGHLEHRRLSAAGPTREHDQLRPVPDFFAAAGVRANR
jgi:hypothetical protein